MTALLVKPAIPITAPVSEPETDPLLSLIARAKARKPHLVAHWEVDENSKLHCEWTVED